MRRRLIAVVSAAALLLLLSAASAQAVGRTFWGVAYTSDNNPQDFTKMQSAKVGIARFPVWHSEVQANGFGAYDTVIGDLASHGVSALPTLMNNPANYTPPISGSARTDWIQFVHDVIARYGPNGSYWSTQYPIDHPGAQPRPLGAVQVGNEPNLPKYWPTSTPVKDYATLLQISHDAIRSVSGTVKIVLAGMPALHSKYVAFPGTSFLDQLYKKPGVKQNFDIAATHPYAENLDQLRLAMKRVRRVMKRHNDKRTPVWITELGYGSAPYNHHLNFGLTGQARMLRKTFRLILDRHRRWHVRGIVWYDWRDPPTPNPDCSFCSTAGLLHADFSTKPAFGAFKHFTGAP